MQANRRQRSLDARQIAHLADRLRTLRLHHGYSMRALADQAGLSSGTVAALERGNVQPTLGTMLSLQMALGLTMLEELLGPIPATPDLPSVSLARMWNVSETDLAS
ncbi:helix-turn-helix domain-containing protein [Aciditerrimonas ferrireducens]|jgi:transcriptional regulator with XRE-family HTH domain|uniref:Helix-turn-helix domain-containing protein n=1 Tax=Aciditerrimonas ferrireducens TaxID=667306 RepID=A0ABV6C0T9_9ACTN